MTTYIHDRTTARVVRHINVVNGEVRRCPRSNTGRKYRVGRVVIHYSWTAGAWKVSEAVLSGTVLKADGSDSKNNKGLVPALEHISSYDTPPMWLDDLADGLRPVGVPELPFNVSQTSDGT